MLAENKGRELERAVHAIETVILESSPALREKSFKIEMRKRLNVADVHHEIDIFVTVEPAKGYVSNFIFECKNWEEAVGKNEIIVFAEKIRAVSAQRGYFVAKSFTKDATAQAQKDPRIALLTATEHDIASTITPECYHITAPGERRVCVAFRRLGASGKNADPLAAQGKQLHLSGADILLTDFLYTWIEELYQERLREFQTAHLAEGTYPMTAWAERTFRTGECIIDGREIENVRLDVEYGVRIIRPAVISDYEVSTRGRVIRLETVNVQDFAISTVFVQAF